MKINVRLLGVRSAVVSERTLGLSSHHWPDFAPRIRSSLRFDRLISAERRTPPNDYDVGDLAHKVVALEAVKFAADGTFEHSYRELEQVFQRTRT